MNPARNVLAVVFASHTQHAPHAPHAHALTRTHARAHTHSLLLTKHTGVGVHLNLSNFSAAVRKGRSDEVEALRRRMHGARPAA